MPRRNGIGDAAPEVSKRRIALWVVIGGGVLLIAGAATYVALKPDMLSAHFSLKDLTRTSHTSVSNEPDASALARLRTLATTFLERIYNKFGPLRINSAYRSPAVNALVSGSAKDSAHMYGCAADFVAVNGTPNSQIVRWIVEESGLPYDQVIEEQSGASKWIHIGMLRPDHEAAPRRQALVMRDGSYTAFV